jgi:hypothetical protein
MRRAFDVGLAVFLAAIVVGCGGSSASDKQVEAITQTYNTYFAAVKSGDGKAACEQLTPAYQRRASKFVTPTKQAQLKGVSCPKAISEGTLSLLKQFKPTLERVQVNGDRASGFQPGEGQFGPQKTIFQRLGGDWKISATIYVKQPPKNSG